MILIILYSIYIYTFYPPHIPHKQTSIVRVSIFFLKVKEAVGRLGDTETRSQLFST